MSSARSFDIGFAFARRAISAVTIPSKALSSASLKCSTD